MVPISFENMKGFFEAKKPKTKKLRNQELKQLRNQETGKPRPLFIFK